MTASVKKEKRDRWVFRTAQAIFLICGAAVSAMNLHLAGLQMELEGSLLEKLKVADESSRMQLQESFDLASVRAAASTDRALSYFSFMAMMALGMEIVLLRRRIGELEKLS